MDKDSDKTKELLIAELAEICVKSKDKEDEVKEARK